MQHRFQGYQVVFQQSFAGLHNVHDHVGQAGEGGQLNGAVQLDDVDLPAAGGIVGLGDVGELGGHPQGPGAGVPEVFGARHAHAAFADVQVQQLVDLRLVLQQDVLTGHADIRRASLHIDAHVRGLDPEVADARVLVGEDQLSAVLPDGRAAIARLLEHGVDVFTQSAFRQGNVNQGLRLLPGRSAVHRDRHSLSAGPERSVPGPAGPGPFPSPGPRRSGANSAAVRPRR